MMGIYILLNIKTTTNISEAGHRKPPAAGREGEAAGGCEQAWLVLSRTGHSFSVTQRIHTAAATRGSKKLGPPRSLCTHSLHEHPKQSVSGKHRPADHTGTAHQQGSSPNGILLSCEQEHRRQRDQDRKEQGVFQHRPI